MKSCAARVAKAIEQLEKRRDLALTGSPTVPLPAVNPPPTGVHPHQTRGCPKNGGLPKKCDPPPPKKTLGMMGVSPCWKFTSGCVTPKKVHPVSEWSYGDPCCSPFLPRHFSCSWSWGWTTQGQTISNIKRVTRPTDLKSRKSWKDGICTMIWLGPP